MILRWVFSFFLFALSLHAENEKEIMDWIVSAKQTILANEAKQGLQERDILFLSFWNFDNTILDGDTTEGSTDIYGNVIFKGLGQVAIEAGYSKKYTSFQKFWNDYEAMEKKDAPTAYAYAAQILAGSQESQVLTLATNYFANTLKPYFFQNAVDLVQALQKQNIGVLLLTASPRIFVQGAAPLLNIPLEDVYGMQTIARQGYLTDQMVLPLTTGKGKIEKIQAIVQEKLRKYRKVYVLAGFGNYNRNDMPFLEWVAEQTWPAGKPLGVVDFHVPSLSKKNQMLLPLNAE